MKPIASFFGPPFVGLWIVSVFATGMPPVTAQAEEPDPGTSKRIDLGDNVSLDIVYIPPGEFLMGSTPEERAWATGPEGGATPGTIREQYEGEARPMRVSEGSSFWSGQTIVLRTADWTGILPTDRQKQTATPTVAGRILQTVDASRSEYHPYSWIR